MSTADKRTETKWTRLSDGEYVRWCPCGKPPEKRGAVVKLKDGSRGFWHWGCIKPADRDSETR